MGHCLRASVAAVGVAVLASCSSERTIQPATSAVVATTSTGAAMRVMHRHQGTYVSGLDTNALVRFLAEFPAGDQERVVAVFSNRAAVSRWFTGDPRIVALANAVVPKRSANNLHAAIPR